MEFGKMLESALGSVTSLFESKTEYLKEEYYFMANWDILLSAHGPASCLVYNWLLFFGWICLCINIGFNLRVTAESVFCYSLAYWAKKHFVQPCSPVLGSGLVCLGSGGSRLRPSDMDSGKLALMSCVQRYILHVF